METNSKKFTPSKSPNFLMWVYSVFAWFVSPTYACDLWEKWEKEKNERDASSRV